MSRKTTYVEHFGAESNWSHLLSDDNRQNYYIQNTKSDLGHDQFDISNKEKTLSFTSLSDFY